MANYTFYHSVRWLRLRAAILRRDQYRCQLSARYGRHVPANTVHHIFPLEDYPEFAFCRWNLISVSEEMHGKLHDRKTGQLTAEGRRLMERTGRRFSSGQAEADPPLPSEPPADPE